MKPSQAAADYAEFYDGISVVFDTKEQYEFLREILGKDIAYIEWVDAMSTRETGLIFESINNDLSIGSVGCASLQRSCRFRIVSFPEFLKSHHASIVNPVLREALENSEKLMEISIRSKALSYHDKDRKAEFSEKIKMLEKHIQSIKNILGDESL